MINATKPIPGGTYKCDEGKLYYAHFTSTDVETKEEVIVYELLYSNQIQHCPVANFVIPDKFTLVKHPPMVPMD